MSFVSAAAEVAASRESFVAQMRRSDEGASVNTRSAGLTRAVAALTNIPATEHCRGLRDGLKTDRSSGDGLVSQRAAL
jgi:hypothetical protein